MQIAIAFFFLEISSCCKTRRRAIISMGRRAKNKQAAPEALEPKTWPSPKKLGKRKAETDAETDGKPSLRPAKKTKDSNGRSKSKPLKATQGISPARKPDSKRKGKKAPQSGSDEDSGDGWEDVDGDADLEARAK